MIKFDRITEDLCQLLMTSTSSATRHVMFVMCLLLAFTSSETRAQDCDVYVNSSDGTDANAGSLSSPVQSLAKGWDLVSDRETLCIAAGSYGSKAEGEALVFAGKNDVVLSLNPFGGENFVHLAFNEIRFESSVRWVSSNIGLEFGSIELGSDSTEIVFLKEGQVDFELPSFAFGTSVRELRLGNGRFGNRLPTTSDHTSVRFVNDRPIAQTSIFNGLDVIFANEASLQITEPMIWDGNRVVQEGGGEVVFSGGVSWVSPETIFEQSANCECRASVKEGFLLGDDQTTFIMKGSDIHIDTLKTAAANALLDIERGDLTVTHIANREGTTIQVRALGGNVRVGSRETITQLPNELEVNGTLILEARESLAGALLKAKTLSAAEPASRLDILVDETVLEFDSIDSLDLYIWKPATMTLGRSTGLVQIENSVNVQSLSTISSLAISQAGTVVFDEDLEVRSLDSFGTLVGKADSKITVGRALQLVSRLESDLRNLEFSESFETASLVGDFSHSNLQITSRSHEGIIFTSSLPHLTQTTGRLTISHLDDEFTSLSSLQITGGEVILSGIKFSLSGDLGVDFGASFTNRSLEPFRIDGTILRSDGTLSMGEAGIGTIQGGMLRIETAITVDQLLVDKPGARIFFTSKANLASKLLLEQGILVLGESSSLTVESDIERQLATIVSEGSGLLVIDSKSYLKVRGFSDSLLPNMALRGSVHFEDRVIRIDGDLHLYAGSLMSTVPEAELDIRGGLSGYNATLILGSGSSASVFGDVELDSITLEAPSASLTFKGVASFRRTHPETTFLRLAATHLFVDDSKLLTEEYSCETPGYWNIAGSGKIRVLRNLVIPTDCYVNLAGSVIETYNADLVVDGRIGGNDFINMLGDSSLWNGGGFFQTSG